MVRRVSKGDLPTKKIHHDTRTLNLSQGYYNLPKLLLLRHLQASLLLQFEKLVEGLGSHHLDSCLPRTELQEGAATSWTTERIELGQHRSLGDRDVGGIILNMNLGGRQQLLYEK